jgi:hypothetical protein
MIGWSHQNLTELKMKWTEAISLDERQSLNLNGNVEKGDRDPKLEPHEENQKHNYFNHPDWH